MFGALGSIGGAALGGPVGSVIGGTIGAGIDADRERQNALELANAQSAAAREAMEAGRFRPVGITTGFGASKFSRDASGNVTGAEYSLDPRLEAQRNQLLGISDQYLGQFAGGQQAAAPLGQGAQSLMGLGQGYLSTSPEAQAQKYFQQQQGLLAPARASQLSELQNRLFQQGRAGLAVGGDAGMLATNPEMAAYYNSIAQQDAQLAAQATQGGMDYAKFGAGMLGLGGDMLGSQYQAQQQAMSPYQTALGGAQTIEGMGQNALDLGVNIGSQGKGGVNQGLLQQGLMTAAQTKADMGGQWSNLFSGANSAIQPYLPQLQQKATDWWRGGPEYGYSTSWGE